MNPSPNLTREELDGFAAIAKAATPGPWEDNTRHVTAPGEVPIAFNVSPNARAGTKPRKKWEADSRHIATFDPPTIARLLALARLGLEAEGKAPWPKLTAAMIQAAAEAHYGKARVARSGGPMGIAMTVDGYDWTFTAMMRRMWPAMKRAALAPKGEQS